MGISLCVCDDEVELMANMIACHSKGEAKMTINSLMVIMGM